MLASSSIPTQGIRLKSVERRYCRPAIPRPARKRSAMRNRDSIELGEEDTGLENKLQVARRTSLDQQELVIHKSPWRRKPTPQRRSPPLQRASSNPIWCKVM